MSLKPRRVSNYPTVDPGLAPVNVRDFGQDAL